MTQEQAEEVQRRLSELVPAEDLAGRIKHCCVDLGANLSAAGAFVREINRPDPKSAVIEMYADPAVYELMQWAVRYLETEKQKGEHDERE